MRVAEGASAPNLRHQNLGAENLYHSLEVISEHMQAHFCTDPLEGLGQEMCAAHPVLDRPEGMLNRLAPDTHTVGCVIQSVLHGLERVLMRPASDASLHTGRAFFLDRALLAIRTPVPVQLQVPFDGSVPPN